MVQPMIVRITLKAFLTVFTNGFNFNITVIPVMDHVQPLLIRQPIKTEGFRIACMGKGPDLCTAVTALIMNSQISFPPNLSLPISMNGFGRKYSFIS